MIEVEHLSKRYGRITAVDDLTFTVRPGLVTGFLGPNGAGKSTTMRMMLGLDRPTSGVVRINGRAFARSTKPLHEIGALLDVNAFDNGRTARNHLRQLGATVGIGNRRVDEVLEIVGLTEVAGQRAGSFSLGMCQRLGIAAALLADPGILLLDEPANRLDLDSIRWLRSFLRGLADEGRTVFLSSHLMSEMELTADHLVIVGHGGLLADIGMAELIDRVQAGHVEVVSPQAETLAGLVANADVAITRVDEQRLEITGRSATEIGVIAFVHSIELHALTAVQPSLETAYLSLAADATRFQGHLTHRKVA
ncbi:ATP-binding cassette domain-containing protein [Nocardia sp. CA2R105]|uniref:ABC transporter ATP-binding protein n=1 Tax=Nocardia coffeae TaxID=2873381 RepID=UPI001CA6E424|nr:ATP-binding cassette domain-containing protein [Nocardia coffeae]